MQPKADMVLKECGYMDCMTFPCSSAMARDGELIYKHSIFSSRSHDLPTKLKLHNNQVT